MRTIKVELKGISPLLMHRFGEAEQAAVQKRTSRAGAGPPKEEAAEAAAYRFREDGEKGNLYIPAQNLLASFRRAAGFHKIGRRSATTAICAGISIRPDALDLGTAEYEIDSRPVVIRATKGRVVRHRPKLADWRVAFELDYDETLVPNEELIRSVVDDAGSKVGVGDFRPETRGPFGRFSVTMWKTQ